MESRNRQSHNTGSPRSPGPAGFTRRAVGALYKPKNTLRSVILLIPIVLLPVFALLAFRELQNFRNAIESVEHTYNVILETERYVSLLKDVETGQRGFLLTGKPSFLAPYEAALLEIPNAEKRLRALTANNSEQSIHLDRIFDLAAARTKESARTISAFRERREDEAFAIVDGGVGKRLMDQIRDTVALAKLRDTRQLGSQTFLAERQADFSRLMVGVGGSVLLLIFIAIAGVVEWDSRRRQRAADTIARQEERLRVALLSVPLTLYTTDKNLDYSWVYGAQTGAEEDEEQPLPPVDGVPELLSLKQAVLQSGAGARREISIASAGERLVYDVTVEPLRASDDRSIIGVTVAALDITARAENAEALRRSERRFRNLIDSMPQLVWSCLGNGRPEIYNRQWYEYTGRSPEGVTEDWTPVLHPEDQRRVSIRWRHSLSTGEPYEIEYRCRRHDGKYRWFLGRATAVRDDHGAIERWYGTSTDIHSQKLAEDQLRVANRDLESFAFAAAHDLQEPLRMITIFAQMLDRKLGSGMDSHSRSLLENIIGGAKRTTFLLRDLLSYTDLSRDDDPDELDWNPLTLVVENVMQNLRIAALESAAKVEVGPLPALRGRESHYQQLFQNLIGNAMKYSGGKPPRIVISATDCGSQWIIRVTDHGIGIAPEHHQDIFGVFKRLHGQSIPGTGIGLAICKRLVERRGGTIWVESEGEGQGSSFCFSIPATEARKIGDERSAVD